MTRKRSRGRYSSRSRSNSPELTKITKFTENEPSSTETRHGSRSKHNKGSVSSEQSTSDKGGTSLDQSTSGKGNSSAAEQSKAKKRHRSRSSSHSEDSESDSSSSCSSSKDNNSSKSKRKKHKKSERKKRKKEKKKMKKKLKKEKRKLKKAAKETPAPATVSQSSKDIKPKDDKPKKDDDVEDRLMMDRAKAMAPMTKEEWEKRQSVIRKVYDEETGRHRLIKGDGEVLEEIVSRDRHKEINKQATRGDGAFFQSTLAKKTLDKT